MDISVWRDVVLIIWSMVATVAIIFIAVILFLFYRKTSSLLESADLLVARSSVTVDYIDNEIIKPISRIGTMAQGILQGISIFSSIFNKKENRDE